VAESIQDKLAESLHRELSDPRLVSLVITRVEVSDDLSMATVSVRLLGPDGPDLRKAALRALRSAGGRLRRAIAPRLGLRRVPELRFFYDTGLDAAARVNELLAEIDAERRSED
jgi:ribosome-binding factor A